MKEIFSKDLKRSSAKKSAAFYGNRGFFAQFKEPDICLYAKSRKPSPQPLTLLF
jgi:hypothetical protein